MELVGLEETLHSQKAEATPRITPFLLNVGISLRVDDQTESICAVGIWQEPHAQVLF